MESNPSSGEPVSLSPFVGQRFLSWQEADTFLTEYADKCRFAWCVERSERIVPIPKGAPKPPKPEKGLVYKKVILSCVSGGPRRTNKGHGDRPIQATCKIGCTAKIRLKVIKSENGDDALEVMKFCEEHKNHECLSGYYDAIPQMRKVLRRKAIREKITTLNNAGTKLCIIRTTLRKEDQAHVTQRDIANFKVKLKRERMQGKTAQEKLADTLKDILEEDPGAHISMGETIDPKDPSKKNMEYLFVQTTAMKKNVEKFPGVVLLDHTYKINKHGMPVSVILVMDAHGCGRPAGYAFIANEKSVTIETILTEFKMAVGEEVAAKIKTFIIDKDYAEAKAIKNVFPNANIQLCDFHVSRTLKKRCSKEKPEVSDLVDQLRFCSKPEEFDDLVKNLKQVASDSFMKYFRENWLSCPFAWSFRDKVKSANLGNTTNNRLENHNAKIKMMLGPTKELYEALEDLLEIVKNKEDDVYFRNNSESMKEAYYMHCEDPVVHSILNDLTKYSANIVLWEYNQEVTDEQVEAFQTTTETCECPHFKSFILPCRHVMHQRKLKDVPGHIVENIAPMWKKGNELNFEPQRNKASSQGRVSLKAVAKDSIPTTWNEKYSCAMYKAKAICSILSENGQDQYLRRVAILEELAEMWVSGKEVVLAELTDCHAGFTTTGSGINALGATRSRINGWYAT